MAQDNIQNIHFYLKELISWAATAAKKLWDAVSIPQQGKQGRYYPICKYRWTKLLPISPPLAPTTPS